MTIDEEQDVTQDVQQCLVEGAGCRVHCLWRPGARHSSP